jgi:alkylation response protein AidB-like acyl-CoA dehydrogenase
LRKVISGEWSATMNLTEPHAGSDVGNIRSKAEPQEDGSYKITGTKIYITYGDHDMTDNIIHLVLARTPGAPEGTKGISLFVVPKFMVNDDGSLGAANDVKCIGLEEKLGIHASPTCVMAYGEEGGATGWLVGPEHGGMACMFTMMNNARLHVGLQGVGVAEAATQHALAYAQERKQGRKPGAEKNDNDAVAIINHPDVRRMLLTMRALTDASRAICYENGVMADLAHATGDADAKAKNDLLTPISKAFSTDIANEVGVYRRANSWRHGLCRGNRRGAAFLRDARILPIYEGTNGIQAMDLLVGRKLGNGDTIKADYLGEMKRDGGELPRVEQSGAGRCAGAPQRCHRHVLEETTEWLVAQRGSLDVLAGATPYLRLFGLVAGCHYLARGAHAVTQDDVEPNFARRKTASTQFYAHNLLSAVGGLADAVKAGNEMLEDIGIEAMAS